MNITDLGVVALIVITCTEALKELYPSLGGNTTRLVALLIGGVIGYLAQVGILPIPDTNFVYGLISGVAAVGGHTLAGQIGGHPITPSLNTGVSDQVDPNQTGGQ